jgi:hypothetical protein
MAAAVVSAATAVISGKELPKPVDGSGELAAKA